MSRNTRNMNKNLKTKNIVFWIFLILMISSIPLSQGYDQQSDKQIILTYNFEGPTIQVINIEGNNYDRISMADCVTASNQGEPNIPSKGIHILLPPKSKIDDIQIIGDNERIIGQGFNIDPVGEPIPITSSTISQKISPNEEIYSSNEFFPGKLYTNVGIYNFRGYKILVLLLHPVQYNPVTGKLCYYENINVNIKTSFDDNVNSLFRGFQKDKQV